MESITPGTEKRGWEIGKPDSNAKRTYVWIVCHCGNGRWHQKGLKVPAQCWDCHRKTQNHTFVINHRAVEEYKQRGRK